MTFRALERFRPLKRVLLLAGAAVAVALALAAGPDLQGVFGAIFAGEGRSVYASIYGQTVQPFPKWLDWMLFAFAPRNILTSIAITLACNYSRGIRPAVLYASLAAGLVLTAFDAADGQSGGPLIVSIICNAAGGALLGAFVLVLVALTTKLQAFLVHKHFALPLWFILPVFVGALVSFIVYLCLKTVLHPTRVTISIVASPPYNGYYLHEIGSCLADLDNPESLCKKEVDQIFKPFYDKQDQENEIADSHIIEPASEKFDFLEDVSSPESNQLSWIGSSDSISLHWLRRRDEPVNFVLSVAQGCMNDDKATKVISDSEVMAVAHDSMSLSLSEGLFDISSVQGRGISLAALDEETVRQFNITSSTTGPNLFDLSRFVSDSDVTLNLSASHHLLNLIFMPRQSTPARRIKALDLVINVDGAKKTFQFHPATTLAPENEIVCTATIRSPSQGEYNLDGISVNLFLESRTPKTIKIESMRTDDHLIIKDIDGWVSARDLPAADIDKFVTPGNLAFIGIHSSSAIVGADGIERSFNRRVQTTVFGNLYASATDGKLKISGTADAAYADGIRLNSTRWEGMDVAMKIAILTVVPSIFYYFRNFILLLFSRAWLGWFFRGDR